MNRYDLLALSDLIGRLGQQMRQDSERWFPRWHSPDLGMPLGIAYALGLAGEVGEVANLVKKVARDGHAPVDGEGLGAELADCLTYLLLLADEAGIDIVQEYAHKRKVNESRWGDGACAAEPRDIEAPSHSGRQFHSEATS